MLVMCVMNARLSEIMVIKLEDEDRAEGLDFQMLG